MSIMSMLKGFMRKLNKRPKIQRYIIYAVLVYIAYKIVNEIRFGLFDRRYCD